LYVVSVVKINMKCLLKFAFQSLIFSNSSRKETATTYICVQYNITHSTLYNLELRTNSSIHEKGVWSLAECPPLFTTGDVPRQRHSSEDSRISSPRYKDMSCSQVPVRCSRGWTRDSRSKLPEECRQIGKAFRNQQHHPRNTDRNTIATVPTSNKLQEIYYLLIMP
jgi:hypothetical protein